MQGQLAELRQLLQQALSKPEQLLQEREDNARIEQLRDQLVTIAASPEAAAEFPLTAKFATLNRDEARELLFTIKEQHYAQHKKALDDRSAFGIVEARLKGLSELYQPDHDPNGESTVDRGTTSPALGESAGTRQQPATQAPSPPPRTTIPAELAARSGGSRRPATEAERLREVARQIPASTFREMGLGALLLDGEE